jgi:hypothetical protein
MLTVTIRFHLLAVGLRTGSYESKTSADTDIQDVYF